MIEENLLDGRMFFYLFYSGGKKVLEYQQEINKINVFPVPDADTGTNLASTVRSVMDMIRPDQSFKIITNSIAEAALIGARGNSGVIFAQFLNGINEQTCDCHAISLKEFATSLKNSVRYLYEAISEPVEGTMLTVIREWSEFMYKHKDGLDFRSVFIKSIEAAEKSLRETPEKLKALAKFNVVDAGAKGFVVFLQGILDFLKHQSIKSLLSSHRSIEIVEDIPELLHEKFNFRYCTEALIKGEDLDQREIESIIHSFGDSAVMAGTKKLTRIHVHTDRPDHLMNELRHTGTLTYQKADDMMMQYAAAHERKWNIALVTDSVCDLPSEVLNEYQIHMVPLNLFFGENQYIDKVTITPDKFYHLMEESENLPSTSQPSVKSFVNLYSQLLTNYDSVISVHLSEHLSGTFNGAQTAADKVSKEAGKRITVLDTKTLSGSEGLLVYRLSLEIAKGKTHDEVLTAWKKWSVNTRVLVSVKNMKNLVKSGRVSLLKGQLAKVLGIKPIIAVNKEGKTYLMDKTLSQKGNMKRVMKHLKLLINERKVWQYVVLHANNEEGAGWFTNQMKELSGQEPFAVINSSPVVGAHLGNKTVAVAFMYE